MQHGGNAQHPALLCTLPETCKPARKLNRAAFTAAMIASANKSQTYPAYSARVRLTAPLHPNACTESLPRVCSFAGLRGVHNLRAEQVGRYIGVNSSILQGLA